MKQLAHLQYLINLSILGLLLLAGCAPLPVSVQTQTPSPSPLLVQTSSSRLKTITPVPLLTSMPKIPTPTLTSTETSPTLTPTLVPTLSIEDMRALILGFMQNNGGCDLPCLWGLTPGQTDLGGLSMFLEQFGEVQTAKTKLHKSDYDRVGGIDLFVSQENLVYLVDLDYYRSPGNLAQLVLTANLFEELPLATDPSKVKLEEKFDDPTYNQYFSYYILPNILSLYGKPSQILIQIPPYFPPGSGWEPFNLMLVYEERHTVFVYTSPRARTGQSYVGCPLQSHFQMTTWADKEMEWQQAAKVFSGFWIDPETISDFLPVEEATFQNEFVPFWNVETFYQEFKDPGSTACLETPVNLWPSFGP